MKKQQRGGTQLKKSRGSSRKNELRNEVRRVSNLNARKNQMVKARDGAGNGTQSSVAAAYATGQSSSTARISRTSVNSCRIIHRELIASITGTTAFNILAANSFSLNPGLAATFPWLSVEAQGWQSYKFNKLRACYYTRTGSNIPGSVLLIPDYDASDAAPVSEQIASNYEDTQENAPWKDIKCPMDVKGLAGGLSMKFIRTGALVANQDVKTFDAGNLFVGTIDGTAVSWGKLWLEYDVTLYTPQLPPGGVSGAGTITGAAGMAAATPFGVVATKGPGIIVSCDNTNVVSFTGLSVGSTIVVSYTMIGTVISGGPSFGTLVGLTAKLTMFTGFLAAATTAACSSTFLVTAASASLVLSITATTVTTSDLVVAYLPTPVALL